MKFHARGGWESKKSDDIDYEQLSDFLDTCVAHLSIFNDWEEKFINDMVERVEERKPLTVRQREIIGDLYEKVNRRR